MRPAPPNQIEPSYSSENQYSMPQPSNELLFCIDFPRKILKSYNCNTRAVKEYDITQLPNYQ